MQTGGEKQMDVLSDIQRAIDYIEDNIAADLDFEAIAREAYLSSYHFQRLFSVFCGCTLGEYIRNRKLSLAADDLLHTQAKVIDIALKWGYDTPEGFARAFTRLFGVTPTAARSCKVALIPFERIAVRTLFISEGNPMSQFNQRINERGYMVKENRPVYFTKNMEQTVKWFQAVLGWYGNIDAKDDKGDGVYGCVSSIPGELVNLGIANFDGIHLFSGEPLKQMVGFIYVNHIEALHAFVKKNAWQQITDIEKQDWGAKVCAITTVDGSILRFFEV